MGLDYQESYLDSWICEPQIKEDPQFSQIVKHDDGKHKSKIQWKLNFLYKGKDS